MAGRIEGKVALVTGGASGVGRAAVELFVGEGARVVFTDLDVAGGESLASAFGGRALFIRQDAASAADWDAAMAAVRERFGRLDILVNNAGILLKGSIEDATLDDWQRLMRVNADSVFLGCKAGVAMMKDGGGGSIINMSSIAGIAAKDDYAAYGASKAAIAGLTRAVAAHCRRAKYRIRCNSIHPDGIMTPMTAGSYPQGVDPARFTIDADPMNRACLPADVAAAILFLAEDGSRAVNGIELRVDSGQFVMGI
ncbi:SDR family oxidoreductase [Thauera butanivorans]|uniref:SDR family oxidoreductase n=1 Tax=Thauera butanivorans TaxID=86174 RepID=UPI003AB67EE0